MDDTQNYRLPAMSEADIMSMEDKIYQRLCGNNLTGETAAWLSIFYSHMLRLNNRLAALENVSRPDQRWK